MKKFLCSAALLAASFVGFGQVLYSDYANIPVLNKNLNDSINRFYSVTSHKLTSVQGLEIIDSAVWRFKGFTDPTTKLYTKSFNAKNELQVVFDRAKGKTDNYEDFNLIWANWGSPDLYPMPRTGLYPFPYKVSGTPSTPVIAAVPANEQDTLFGYSVNLYNKPVVRMKVSCTEPTNIRVDLIDKNRRVSNTLAPHHLIKTSDKDTILEFRWDYRPEDGMGEPDYRYEDPFTDDFNIGIAADGWASPWWGVDAGRSETTIPILAGRSGWPGSVLLDLKNIVGVAITLEDGTNSKDHSSTSSKYNYGYSMTAVKTLTIKEMIVGDATNPIQLTQESMFRPTTSISPLSKVYSISPKEISVGSTQTFTVVTTGKPFAYGVPTVLLSSNYGSVVSTTKKNDSIALVTVQISSYSNNGECTLSFDGTTLSTSFTITEKQVLAPNFKSITPASCAQGKTLDVQLSVANADFNNDRPYYIEFKQNSTTVFRSNQVTDLNEESIATTVYVPYSVPAGQYDVYFYYRQGGYIYREVYAMKAFTVTESAKPTITSVSYASALQGTSASVTIKGSNCNFLQNSGMNYYAYFKNENGYSFYSSFSKYTVLDNNTLTVSVSIPKDAPVGSYSMQIQEYSTNGSYSYPILENALNVSINPLLPRLLKAESAYAQQAEKLTVTLSGYNTNFDAQSSVTVLFKQASNAIQTHSTAISFYSITSTVVSATQLSVSVEIPRMANLGYYDIVATSNNESITLVRGFVVTENANRPHIVSISKTEAKQGEKIELTIIAKDINFKTKVTGIQVLIGEAFSYVSSSSITVVDENTIVASLSIPDNLPAKASQVFVVCSLRDITNYNYTSEYYIAPQTITINETQKQAEEVTVPTDNKELLSEMSVRPTITSGEFIIDLPIAAQVEVVDLMGTVVVASHSQAQGKYEYSIANYAAGLYKVIIRTESEIKTVSVVKQ